MDIIKSILLFPIKAAAGIVVGVVELFAMVLSGIGEICTPIWKGCDKLLGKIWGDVISEDSWENRHIM